MPRIRIAGTGLRTARQTAARDLDELVKKGAITRYGIKRGVYYVLKEKMP